MRDGLDEDGGAGGDGEEFAGSDGFEGGEERVVAFSNGLDLLDEYCVSLAFLWMDVGLTRTSGA